VQSDDITEGCTIGLTKDIYCFFYQSIMSALATNIDEIEDLEHVGRLRLKLDFKFEDGNYVVIIEHSMGYIWSLFIRDLLVLIFQKLGKIKPKVSISFDNKIVVCLPANRLQQWYV
jgi:hypothetical protein